ncbi:hypothetical protein ACO0R3_000610 [Hanseniaspora guilliermondii]
MTKFLNNSKKRSFLHFGKVDGKVESETVNESKTNLIQKAESFKKEGDTFLLSEKPTLSKKMSIKNVKSNIKKNINVYVDPLNNETRTKLLPSPVLANVTEKPFINSSYIYNTDEEQLEDNIIDHKIHQKLNIFLNIYNTTKFGINLDKLELNEKKQFFSNLTYIETLFHYENKRNSIESSDLKKIESVDSLVYQKDYNIFNSINDINPSSTKHVIRGLRIHFQSLIEQYHHQASKNKNSGSYEDIFTIWDNFNDIFTFDKMLKIETNLKTLFPRRGCSLSEIYLQFKLYSIFNSKDLLTNIKSCFQSLIYMFLLNDGLMFWDDYLKILTIDEDVYKSFPQVLVYDNLVLVFEFLEMLIFLIGQFSFKPFLDIIQYLKHFSLIFFSLENCLNLKNDHRFKDLKEFSKVTDKLSHATLIILEKYLLSLSKDNQLNDFLILERLSEYLANEDDFNNESQCKRILTMSQPILKTNKIPKTKYSLVSSILTNLGVKKKFINGERYFVSDILIHFLKFLPNNFKQFHERMIVKKKVIMEFAKSQDDLIDDIDEYMNLINEKRLKLESNNSTKEKNFDIRKFLFDDNNQYRYSDWIDINEFSEFGQSLFLSDPNHTSNMTNDADTPSKLNIKLFKHDKGSIDVGYTAIEIDTVENWVISCFQNNHPLIFPYHLNHQCNTIYKLKTEYSSKLDIDFVYFKFLKIDDEKKKKNNKRKSETRDSINVMNLTLDNFNTPIKTKEEHLSQYQHPDYSGNTIYINTIQEPKDNSSVESTTFHKEYGYLYSDLSMNKVNAVEVMKPIVLDNLSYDEESHYTTQTPIIDPSMQSDYINETPNVEYAQYFNHDDGVSSISSSLNLQPNTATKDTYERFMSSSSN